VVIHFDRWKDFRFGCEFQIKICSEAMSYCRAIFTFIPMLMDLNTGTTQQQCECAIRQIKCSALLLCDACKEGRRSPERPTEPRAQLRTQLHCRRKARQPFGTRLAD